jgi:hypothetical protein
MTYVQLRDKKGEISQVQKLKPSNKTCKMNINPLGAGGLFFPCAGFLREFFFLDFILVWQNYWKYSCGELDSVLIVLRF